jgi:polyribonucleotide nucleotidyltransferase
MILFALLLIALAAIVVGDCLYQYNNGVNVRDALAELVDGFIVHDNTER